MKQEQKAMLYIPMRHGFKAGALEARSWNFETYPTRGREYLDGIDLEAFDHDGPRIDYLVKSSGIPVAWHLKATDDAPQMWCWTSGDHGKTYSRHRALVQKAVEFDKKRRAA